MVGTNIWYIEFKEANVNNLQILLSEKEIEKSNRFLKNRDKNSYIISHAFLRILLTKYFPNIKPKEWTFEKTKYGKPIISKKHHIKLHFNLSHTYSYAAVILSSLGECGIDIEEDRGMVIDNNLIDLVLTKKEKDIYYLDKKRENFYIFWTLKEAYLKAKGLGFSISPKEIDFNFLKKIDRKKNIFIKDNYQYGIKYISKNVYLSYVVKNIKKEIKLNLSKFSPNILLFYIFYNL